MIELRPYQTATIDALYNYFATADGNPLAVMPTGVGKSVCIAAFMQRAINDWPDTRILMVTHQRELISQDFGALIRLWPEAPAGIYSAGLNRRDVSSQIVFAGIQSIYKRAYDVQRCDLLMIDEAQLLSRDAAGMYQKFIGDLRQINPDMKVVGWTATPFRMDSGLLHEGKDRLFTDIAYQVSILDMIDQGYLSPIRARRTTTQLDVSSVGTRGGEFVAAELEAAVDQRGINESVVSEIIERGQDRGSWLIFCAGVKHAEHIRDMLLDRDIVAATVTGDTPAAERDRLLAAFKAGHIRAMTNMGVLTTGFDAPGIDLIAMLRPTKSIGLYVQMAGRGTRLAPGKDDCLLLDFAGNVFRHGPIDLVDGRRREKSDEPGKAPVKLCQHCGAENPTKARACYYCGAEFPPAKPNLSARASTDAVLSTQIESVWIEVTEVSYRRHEKTGSPPSMRVDYHCGLARHSEWICCEHSGFPRQKAAAWWIRRAPHVPVPATVADAIAASAELPRPVAIQVRPIGKYTEVCNVRFA